MDSPTTKTDKFRAKAQKLDKMIRDQSKLMVERCQALYEYDCLHCNERDKGLYTDELVDRYCEFGCS